MPKESRRCAIFANERAFLRLPKALIPREIQQMYSNDDPSDVRKMYVESIDDQWEYGKTLQIARLNGVETFEPGMQTVLPFSLLNSQGGGLNFFVECERDAANLRTNEIVNYEIWPNARGSLTVHHAVQAVEEESCRARTHLNNMERLLHQTRVLAEQNAVVLRPAGNNAANNLVFNLEVEMEAIAACAAQTVLTSRNQDITTAALTDIAECLGGPIEIVACRLHDAVSFITWHAASSMDCALECAAGYERAIRQNLRNLGFRRSPIHSLAGADSIREDENSGSFVQSAVASNRLTSGRLSTSWGEISRSVSRAQNIQEALEHLDWDFRTTTSDLLERLQINTISAHLTLKFGATWEMLRLVNLFNSWDKPAPSLRPPWRRAFEKRDLGKSHDSCLGFLITDSVSAHGQKCYRLFRLMHKVIMKQTCDRVDGTLTIGFRVSNATTLENSRLRAAFTLRNDRAYINASTEPIPLKPDRGPGVSANIDIRTLFSHHPDSIYLHVLDEVDLFIGAGDRSFDGLIDSTLSNDFFAAHPLICFIFDCCIHPSMLTSVR